MVTIVRTLDDGCIRNYPDPEGATAELAGAIGVPADRLLLTNGGAEAIALVAAEHPEGVVPEPAFSLYRRHLARVEQNGAGLVWRANPSSPLGEIAPTNAEAGVWDEAFWPLATGRGTRGRRRIPARLAHQALELPWPAAGLRDRAKSGRA